MRAIREKEGLIKTERRLDTTVNNIKLSTPLLLRQQEELKQNLQYIGMEDKELRGNVQVLRKDIDLALYDYLQQNQLEQGELEKAERYHQLNKKLDKDLEVEVKKFSELNRHVEEINSDRSLRVLALFIYLLISLRY